MSTASDARRLVWMIPALGLLACAKKEAPPPAAAAAPESTAAMAMPAAPVTATVQAKNNSGITGTVTLTKSGDSTQVAVALSGGRAGQKYPSHIHGGTCAKPGAVVAPLADVAVGKDKSGTSTTMVLTSVLDSARTKFGSLVEQSHMARGMRPVACAEIPAQ
jgi:hypothetical protein